jgi:hypothetical protein
MHEAPLPRRGTEVAPVDAASFRHDDGMYARRAPTERRLITALPAAAGSHKRISFDDTISGGAFDRGRDCDRIWWMSDATSEFVIKLYSNIFKNYNRRGLCR